MALILSLAHAQPVRAQDVAPTTDWIRHTAKPFETCEPRAEMRDLASLRQIVGNAHIVALGDGTRGTREFFQLKHRIVQYLATEMGFTTVVIEANLPEASKINDFVLTGRGDPRALLKGLKYWPWNTEEMLEFVEWMRRFNESGRGHLQFLGFDMLKPDVPAEIVQTFLRRVDPAWADSVDSLTRSMSRARHVAAKGVVVRGELPARDVAGHHVRFSGWLRTEDVSEYTGLWLRADAEGVQCAFDNMERQQIAGTHDWKRYALELDIPGKADHVVFGGLMTGTGKAWFDSLAIEIDGKLWTDPGRVDLVMESADAPVGFRLQPPPGYDIRMEDTAAAAGRWSLCLSSRKNFLPVDPAPQWAAVGQSAERIIRRIESEGRRYRRGSIADEVAWAERNAHLLLQRSRLESAHDSSMAANVAWIIGRLPKRSKIVLWTHNSHAARTEGAMGDWLARRFGNDMVVIGLATNEGQCSTTKTTSAGLEATELEPGPHGSFEALARASAIPSFILDLRRAKYDTRVAAQLAAGLTMRSIGHGTPSQQFWPTALLREFDVIAWVQKTQATRSLEH